MQAKLVVVGGRATKKEISLSLPTEVGRGDDANVTILHPSISRKHCELFERDGQLVLRDAGSANGTFVGERKITEAVLQPGDTFTIGPLTFQAVYEAPSVANGHGGSDAASGSTVAPQPIEDAATPAPGDGPEDDSFDLALDEPVEELGLDTPEAAEEGPAAEVGEVETAPPATAASDDSAEKIVSLPLDEDLALLDDEDDFALPNDIESTSAATEQPGDAADDALGLADDDWPAIEEESSASAETAPPAADDADWTDAPTEISEGPLDLVDNPEVVEQGASAPAAEGEESEEINELANLDLSILDEEPPQALGEDDAAEAATSDDDQAEERASQTLPLEEDDFRDFTDSGQSFDEPSQELFSVDDDEEDAIGEGTATEQFSQPSDEDSIPDFASFDDAPEQAAAPPSVEVDLRDFSSDEPPEESSAELFSIDELDDEAAPGRSPASDATDVGDRPDEEPLEDAVDAMDEPPADHPVDHPQSAMSESLAPPPTEEEDALPALESDEATPFEPVLEESVEAEESVAADAAGAEAMAESLSIEDEGPVDDVPDLSELIDEGSPSASEASAATTTSDEGPLDALSFAEADDSIDAAEEIDESSLETPPAPEPAADDAPVDPTAEMAEPIANLPGEDRTDNDSLQLADEASGEIVENVKSPDAAQDDASGAEVVDDADTDELTSGFVPEEEAPGMAAPGTFEDEATDEFQQVEAPSDERSADEPLNLDDSDDLPEFAALEEEVAEDATSEAQIDFSLDDEVDQPAAAEKSGDDFDPEAFVLEDADSAAVEPVAEGAQEPVAEEPSEAPIDFDEPLSLDDSDDLPEFAALEEEVAEDATSEPEIDFSLDEEADEPPAVEEPVEDFDPEAFVLEDDSAAQEPPAVADAGGDEVAFDALEDDSADEIAFDAMDEEEAAEPQLEFREPDREKLRKEPLVLDAEASAAPESDIESQILRPKKGTTDRQRGKKSLFGWLPFGKKKKGEPAAETEAQAKQQSVEAASAEADEPLDEALPLEELSDGDEAEIAFAADGAEEESLQIDDAGPSLTAEDDDEQAFPAFELEDDAGDGDGIAIDDVPSADDASAEAVEFEEPLAEKPPQPPAKSSKKERPAKGSKRGWWPFGKKKVAASDEAESPSRPQASSPEPLDLPAADAAGEPPQFEMDDDAPSFEDDVPSFDLDDADDAPNNEADALPVVEDAEPPVFDDAEPPIFKAEDASDVEPDETRPAGPGVEMADLDEVSGEAPSFDLEEDSGDAPIFTLGDESGGSDDAELESFPPLEGEKDAGKGPASDDDDWNEFLKGFDK